MILLFLTLIGVLLLLIGIWKRMEIYGKVFIGLGVLLIGISFFGPFGIFYSCEKYSAHLKNELQRIDKPCKNSDDCELISYYPCKPYCINKNVDLSSFYFLQRNRPLFCPRYKCMPPQIKWECTCENNVCFLKGKEIVEEKIEETANWKTYRNEEYGFEIKYPNDWEISLFGKPPSNVVIEFAPQEFKERTGLLVAPILIKVHYFETQFLKQSLDQYLGQFQQEDIKEILINNVPAKEVKGEYFHGPFHGIYIEIPNTDNFLEIIDQIDNYRQAGRISSEELEVLHNIFNQMLSTFRFLK